MSLPLITLLTDFGWGSSYVAQLKGVVLSSLPEARVVDVSHGVAPHGIREGELLLRGTAFAFPQGTVHIAVVDPGVGSVRRPIAVASRGMWFVGPDNGLLAGPLAQPGARAVLLDRDALFRKPVSPTFHGRDIFAPVACELAAGLTLEDVGSPLVDPVASTLPAPVMGATHVLGETLLADRFGNLLTNLPARHIDPQQPIEVAGRTCRVVDTYAEAAAGELVALAGSEGFLEVALREASARAHLGAEAGLVVRARRIIHG
jgi:S-adenosylmethionine hydrolase